MYRKIVIPLDGSLHAEQIFPHMQRLDFAPGTEIILVSNVDTNAFAWTGAEEGVADMFLNMAYGQVQAYLLRQQRMLSKYGYQVHIQIVKGDTASSIVDVASEADADLIAMTTHGRSGIARWVLGSVAERVVHLAYQPVLLVRSTANTVEPLSGEPIKRILLPLDGSALAEQALPYTQALVEQTGATVLLLRAILPFSGSEMESMIAEADWPATELERLMDAEQYLARIQKRLMLNQIVSDMQIVVGQPAPAILDIATVADIDLIIMGTHGRSGYKRWRYGSVASQVLYGATTPLLLVRGLQVERNEEPSYASAAPEMMTT
jgi:nucleotide-binding universal stress UspA family protein